jgi:hypothetical protein
VISCLAPVLGRNVLDLRGPARDASEAEANQVGKEKMRNSYGLVSDRPHATLQRGTCASNDPRSTSHEHLTPTDGKALRGPSGRRLNIQPPTGGQHRQATFEWWNRQHSLWQMTDTGLCSGSTNTEVVSMAFQVGKRVVADFTQVADGLQERAADGA